MRIDIAYCNELERNVDIYAACIEFSIQDQHKKFTFKCSDPDCNAAVPSRVVRVTGVNHQFLPEDDNVSKSPHFRVWDEHSPSCMWHSFEAAIRELIAELPADSAIVQFARKNRRLISKFILPESADEIVDEHKELVEIIRERNSQVRRSNIKKYISSVGATTRSFEALISCYDQLKAMNKLSEELLIPGVGKTTYRQFFKRAKYYQVGANCIWSGGAKLYKRYGKGFALTFFDKHNNLPIDLYLSNDQLNASKYGKHLTRIVDEIESNPERPYLKIYWFGSLEGEQHNDRKCYRVKVESLSHLVMRVTVPQVKPEINNE